MPKSWTDTQPFWNVCAPYENENHNLNHSHRLPLRLHRATTQQTQTQPPPRTASTAPTQQTQIPPPPIISYTAPTGPAYMKITERIVYRGIADDDIIDHINYLKQVPNNALEVALFTIIWGVKNKNRPDLPKVAFDQLGITTVNLINELKWRGLWESFVEEIERSLTKEAETVRKLLHE